MAHERQSLLEDAPAAANGVADGQTVHETDFPFEYALRWQSTQLSS
jgi:hypothetical protein